MEDWKELLGELHAIREEFISELELIRGKVHKTENSSGLCKKVLEEGGGIGVKRIAERNNK